MDAIALHVSPLEVAACVAVVHHDRASCEQQFVAGVVLVAAIKGGHAPTKYWCQLISVALSLALRVDWVTVFLVFFDPTFAPKRRRAPSRRSRSRPPPRALAEPPAEPSAESPAELAAEIPASQPPAAEGAPTGEGESEDLSPGEKQRLDRCLKRVKFCMVCSGGSLCYEGWAHKTRTKHEMRALTEDEKKRVERDWRRKHCGGPEEADGEIP